MSNKDLLEVETLRDGEARSYRYTVTRIQDELDRLIKIFSHMRQCFENEMFEGMGYKKMTVTPSQLNTGKELAVIMEKMVSAKVRWDKASKEMASTMTPEEERAACYKYIQSLSAEDRKYWMEQMKRWMEDRHEYIRTGDDSARPEFRQE